MHTLFELDSESIPFYNHEGVLPPYIGSPSGSDRSPYDTQLGDVILRFGTSKKRCDILKGFVHLRNTFFRCGFKGFQWVDGSFVENINREPNDIDVINFVSYNIHPAALEEILFSNSLITHFNSKEIYHCDSYCVDISNNIDPSSLVEQTAYWYSLFSHNREKVWKGMLRIPLAESYHEMSFCLAMIESLEASYE